MADRISRMAKEGKSMKTIYDTIIESVKSQLEQRGFKIKITRDQRDGDFTTIY